MVVSHRPRRFVLVLLALVLVGLFVRQATAQMIPTPEVCKRTTPADWEWWENLCWNYPTAGAQVPAHIGFLIR